MGFLTVAFIVVKILVFASAGLAFVWTLITTFWTWADGKDLGHPLMKFKQWRDLYNLNPENGM